MGRRGPKPKGLIKTIWSSKFAYAIGLIASDGGLSKDGRHLDLTSKDLEQIVNFLSCLNVKRTIGTKSSGTSRRRYYRVQISDVLFYNFLLKIGLTPAKSKTLKRLAIPRKYFFDFLRGLFDGDGCTYSFWDSIWKESYRFYTSFTSASLPFLLWLQEVLGKELQIQGHISSTARRAHQLKFAKHDSFKLLKKMYSGTDQIYLKRKRLKIDRALDIVGMRL